MVSDSIVKQQMRVRIPAAGSLRRPHQHRSSARRQSVHRISHPTSVTISQPRANVAASAATHTANSLGPR